MTQREFIAQAYNAIKTQVETQLPTLTDLKLTKQAKEELSFFKWLVVEIHIWLLNALGHKSFLMGKEVNSLARMSHSFVNSLNKISAQANNESNENNVSTYPIR